MIYVDSHCHLNLLDLSPFQGNLDPVLKQAENKGVQYFLSVAVTLDDHAELVAIAERYQAVFMSVGLHPNEKPGEIINKSHLLAQANHPKVIAIGETGLDYYRTHGDLSWQQARFAAHIACARECKKPLIIHTRAAREETLAIMRMEHAREVGGVMHCFTEDWETAKQALDLGFYISFSGIVTFKNAKEVQEVASKVPLDRLLIETDAPYLAPVPYRGQSNLPEYVCEVAKYIATLRGEPLTRVAEQTTQNFFTLFSASSLKRDPLIFPA